MGIKFLIEKKESDFVYHLTLAPLVNATFELQKFVEYMMKQSVYKRYVNNLKFPHCTDLKGHLM